MDVVALDFETFYGDDYTLSKLTTEEYIRDPRFETIGVSIAEPGKPTRWVVDNIEGELRALRLEERMAVAHNGLFDFAILGWRYNIHPKVMACTLKMARPFHRVAPGLSLAKLSRHYDLPDKGNMVVAMKNKRRSDMTPYELQNYGPLYANIDAENCLRLFQILSAKLPAAELASIHIILEMFTKPHLLLNQRKLVDYTREVIARRKDLLGELQGTMLELVPKLAAPMPNNMALPFAPDDWRLVVPRMEEIMGDRFPTWLRSRASLRFLDKVVDNTLPRSPKTGEPSLTKTSRKTQELLESDDEFVRGFVEARLGTQSSLDQTRAIRFLGISTRGALPVPLAYYGAHTGRLAGTDKINLQNLPSRTGKALKQSIEAPEGYVLLDADSSQIEARLAALFCGQMDLVNQFAMGEDVYSSYATERFGYPVTKANKKERMLGKVSILSLQYGVGHDKYREMARIQGGIMLRVHEALDDVNFYRARFPQIKQMWNRLTSAMQAMLDGSSFEINQWARVEGNKIIRPNGMALEYPGLTRIGDEVHYCNNTSVLLSLVKANMTGDGPPKDTMVKLYGAKILENIIQALASDIIREKMVVLRRIAPVLLQVHDSIILLVKLEDLHAAHSYVTNVMRTPPAWMPNLPLDCEVAVGYTYGDADAIEKFNPGERA